MSRRTIAVLGNPNSGKTTLFNGLTGSNKEVGNWPGVTVEKVEGRLSAMDTKFASSTFPGFTLFRFFRRRKDHEGLFIIGEADLIVDILDATNLERNLYLTCQLLELKKPLLLVLNMMDLAEKKGFTIETDHLANHLSSPVVAVTAQEERDILKVKKAIFSALDKPRLSTARVDYPDEIEAILSSWKGRLSSASKKPRRMNVSLG